MSRAAGSERARRGAGIALALQAVVLVVVAGAQDPALRPVTATLGGNTARLVSRVDVGIAFAVVVALLALARFLPPRWAAWVDPLLTTPIAVFVVAELNGVRDVGALVGIYALASAGVLFRMVHAVSARERAGAEAGAGRGTGSRRALGYGAAVGIVPWGIVAFHQVGAGIVGSPVGVTIVLITLLALATAIGEFVAVWRGSAIVATSVRIVGLSAVAWVVVAAV